MHQRYPTHLNLQRGSLANRRKAAANWPEGHSRCDNAQKNNVSKHFLGEVFLVAEGPLVQSTKNRFYQLPRTGACILKSLLKGKMAPKRRLSHGSTASSLLGDINEEEFPLPGDAEVESGAGGPPGLNGNRRRSMMGGKNRRMSSGASAAEQSRIAEMYKTVIKLSSENVRGAPLSLYIYIYTHTCAHTRRLLTHSLTRTHHAENQREELVEPGPD